MNVLSHHHAFASPAMLAALRADIAARRKARSVNLAIHSRQHGSALLAVARFRLDRSAQTALGRLLAAGAAEDRWTPAQPAICVPSSEDSAPPSPVARRAP